MRGKTAQVLGSMLVVVLLVLFATTKCQCSEQEWAIIVDNTTQEVLSYWVYYVDHPFQKDWPRPMNIAGGSIDPESVWEWKQKWGDGRYFIVFRLGEYKAMVPFEVDRCVVSVRIDVPRLTVAYEKGQGV